MPILDFKGKWMREWLKQQSPVDDEDLDGSFNCGRLVVRDGPAQGVFRLVFDEAEFPGALAGLDA